MDSSKFLVPLLIVGCVAADSLPATNATGSNLDCTHDFEEQMFCQFDAQSCAKHVVKLRSNINSDYGEKQGLFQTCGSGRCCCSLPVGEMLTYGDTLTATVWKNAHVVESRQVSINNSFKPKAPTIVSVRESSGNFQLMWTTNAQSNYIDTELSANVTYYKKGSREKVTKHVASTKVNGFNYYEISGGELEPSTTYVVSVRSYTGWSGMYSDCSQEAELTTGMSPRMLLLAVLIPLSAFAVTVTAVVFGCYVQLKKKWWDAVPGPMLLIPHPSKTPHHHEPRPPVMSSVDIQPPDQDDVKSCLQMLLTDTSGGSAQHSSGISAGSSAVSYAKAEPDVRVGVQNALLELFPSISPGSGPSCPLRYDTSAGSSGMDNRSYSLVIPSCSLQTPVDEARLACVSAYHPSEGDAVTPAHLLLKLPAPSVLPTDMSYHRADDSGLSSVSSGSNAATSCDPCSDEAMACDEPPRRAQLLADAYQAFQSVARHPGEPGIPGFPPQLHRPLTSLMCPQIPIITSAGYQSV